MNPYISVHVIAKENTNLGVQFTDACFTSLYESQYPNEIILVDNGSFDKQFDLYNVWKNKFKEFDCNLVIVNSDIKDFAGLRNTCLAHTNPNSNFFHWIDTDEIYYEEDLDILKNQVLSNNDIKISQAWSYFYHFMIHPFQIQVDNVKTKKLDDLVLDDYRVAKDNIFAFNTDVQWVKEKKVHEKVKTNASGVVVQSQVEYIHLGYTRQQWRTVVKWLHYALLEYGNVNCYKLENCDDGTQKEYLRDWRTPDSDFLWDRRAISLPFPNSVCRNSLPLGFQKLLNGCKNEQDWVDYINKLDDCNFLNEWIYKRNKEGSWSKTLDWVVKEMEKRDWRV